MSISKVGWFALLGVGNACSLQDSDHTLDSLSSTASSTAHDSPPSATNVAGNQTTSAQDAGPSSSVGTSAGGHESSKPTTSTSTQGDSPSSHTLPNSTSTSLPSAANTSIESSSSSPGGGEGGVERGISIFGRGIFVDGELFHIKGVNWNPIAQGNTHPDDLDYEGFADRDIPLMKAAGINAVRTYERLESTEVLDKLHAAGIYVFTTVLGWWQDDPSVVTERVNAVKDHPAILAWVLGNEWNYNQLYSDGQLSNPQVRDRLNEAAMLIKAADSNHPVATIFGELHDIGDMLTTMPEIDVWGINAYRGKDHAALFNEWAALSTKPMFVGEYGADAWDGRGDGQENLATQAEATTVLTQQIVDAYTTTSGGITSGGFIFEWADEWWKAGNADVHDSSPVLPDQEGGPYPDGLFNEEWWGIVDIDRNPRPAYDALKAIYLAQ